MAETRDEEPTMRQSASHRERLVYVTAQQVRRSGVSGTGLRGIVEEAGAPWGSLQHYFPGGKDELVGEALEWSGRYAAERVRAHLAAMRRPTGSRLFAAIVQDWVRELEARDHERGCPVAATVVDCAVGNGSLRSAAVGALDTWRAPITVALTEMGHPRRRAESLSTVMLCALEGAILLARAQRSTAPLRTVARELGPVFDVQR